MPKVIIDRFDGGMVNDPRTTIENVCRMSINFDAETDPHRLIPLNTSEDGDIAADTNKIQNFCVAEKPSQANTYVVYGLGVQSGASDAKLFFKDIKTTGSNNLADDAWNDAGSDGLQAGGNTKFDCFFYYKRVGKIIGAQTAQYLWSYDPVNDTFKEQEVDLTSFTNIAQGLVHSKDDIAYVPYDNKVAKNLNGTWTEVALTLAEQFRIRPIAEFGNFLAIGTEPISGASPGVGSSYVFFWDRDSTLLAMSDMVYWGEERLQVLGQINGVLVGVSVASGTTWFNRRIVFRYLEGNRAVKFAEFTSSTADIIVSQLGSSQQLFNNRLYFNMGFTVNGTVRTGVWSIGGRPGAFNINIERSINNDTPFIVGTENMHGFLILGDYIFQSFDDNGTDFTISKTTDGDTFTAKSVWESTINPKMPIRDRGKNKQLVAVRVTYEPLPAAGQVVLNYRVDGASLYTTVLTETENNILFTERNDASDGEFTSGREYEFQIESTGGAVITGLEYDYEILDTLL